MDARYTNQPYMVSYPTPSPQPRYPTPSNTSKESIDTTSTHKNSFLKFGTVWTLAAHCILSVVVSLLMLVYVAGRHFNVSERTPLVKIVEGTQLAPFLPIQSDIVTFLSSILAVVKVALSAWMGLLTWNAALLLMERRGLARRDLKILLNYGVLAPGAYSLNWSSLIIGALFLASIVANLASPILTGSISWVPSNRPVRGLSIDPVEIGDVENGAITELSSNYMGYSQVRDAYTSTAIGFAGIGWGRDIDKGVLKRVCDPVVGLSLNSTVENITLPFFQVHSIRWIENHEEIPGIRDGKAPIDILNAQFNMTPVKVAAFPVGYAVLVPNVTTNWSSDPLESTTIHDTRLLMLLYGVDFTTGEHFSRTRDLPPGAFKQSYSDRYHAFAWVTFSAGVGQCRDYNCAVSSPSTIRNNNPIEIAPHQLTFQALSMAPVVAVQLIQLNNSIPYMWDNINDYVEAVLVRSYSGAWLSLNDNMWTIATSARYIPSLPSLLADIDRKRVYIWLALQLLVTLLSVIFLIVQSNLSRYPLMGDTSLIAFNLDTTAVASDKPVTEVRKIEQQDGRLVIKDELV